MISANNITLCCIDTRHHPLSAIALRQCTQAMQFGKTVFLTDRAEHVDSSWEHHRIRPFQNFDEFNRFMLKSLYFHIETDYVLLVQFDGFIVNEDIWSADFLNYDYIGAPWPNSRKDYAVGTGGFCLRSKKLLAALQDDRVYAAGDTAAEDVCICRTNRSYLETQYGITFAPLEVATSFCYESGPFVSRTFGFHGLDLMAAVYGGDVATFLINNLDTYLMQKNQAVVLALNYIFGEQYEAGTLLLKRIARDRDYDSVRTSLMAPGVADRAKLLELLERSWPR